MVRVDPHPKDDRPGINRAGEILGMRGRCHFFDKFTKCDCANTGPDRDRSRRRRRATKQCNRTGRHQRHFIFGFTHKCCQHIGPGPTILASHVDGFMGAQNRQIGAFKPGIAERTQSRIETVLGIKQSDQFRGLRDGLFFCHFVRSLLTVILSRETTVGCWSRSLYIRRNSGVAMA